MCLKNTDENTETGERQKLFSMGSDTIWPKGPPRFDSVSSKHLFSVSEMNELSFFVALLCLREGMILI